MPTHHMYEVDWPWYTAYRDDFSCTVADLPPWNLGRWVALESAAGRLRWGPQASQPQPTQPQMPEPQPISPPSSEDEEPMYDNLPRRVIDLDPSRWNPGLGRYWHHGARGTGNPRNVRQCHREPIIAQPVDAYPVPVIHTRTQQRIRPPQSLFLTEPPVFASRSAHRALRGCVIMPSLLLPDSYHIHPECLRAYYTDNNGRLRCMLPCSTTPFCPFQSACGRGIRAGTAEATDDHGGHQCSRCKEFADLGRSPFEWFDAVPRDLIN